MDDPISRQDALDAVRLEINCVDPDECGVVPGVMFGQNWTHVCEKRNSKN